MIVASRKENANNLKSGEAKGSQSDSNKTFDKIESELERIVAEYYRESDVVI